MHADLAGVRLGDEVLAPEDRARATTSSARSRRSPAWPRRVSCRSTNVRPAPPSRSSTAPSTSSSQSVSPRSAVTPRSHAAAREDEDPVVVEGAVIRPVLEDEGDPRSDEVEHDQAAGRRSSARRAAAAASHRRDVHLATPGLVADVLDVHLVERQVEGVGRVGQAQARRGAARPRRARDRSSAARPTLDLGVRMLAVQPRPGVARGPRQAGPRRRRRPGPRRPAAPPGLSGCSPSNRLRHVGRRARRRPSRARRSPRRSSASGTTVAFGYSSRIRSSRSPSSVSTARSSRRRASSSKGR